MFGAHLQVLRHEKGSSGQGQGYVSTSLSDPHPHNVTEASDIFLCSKYSYSQRAAADVEAVRTRVHALLAELHVNADRVSDHEIKLFCKNAAFLRVIECRSLRDEHDPSKPSAMLQKLAGALHHTLTCHFSLSCSAYAHVGVGVCCERCGSGCNLFWELKISLTNGSCARALWFNLQRRRGRRQMLSRGPAMHSTCTSLCVLSSASGATTTASQVSPYAIIILYALSLCAFGQIHTSAYGCLHAHCLSAFGQITIFAYVFLYARSLSALVQISWLLYQTARPPSAPLGS